MLLVQILSVFPASNEASIGTHMAALAQPTCRDMLMVHLVYCICFWECFPYEVVAGMSVPMKSLGMRRRRKGEGGAW